VVAEPVSPDHEEDTPPGPVEATGPWPFITQCVFKDARDSQQVWVSRVHRKGLARRARLTDWHETGSWLWAPSELNWWIGTVFALGALLFAAGCLFSLSPSLDQWFKLTSTQINVIFFAGSIPFTTAAYLQLYQSANAPVGHSANAQTPRQRRLLGWRPKDIGWLSCALQFPGTVLFNFNTFDAMIPGLHWWQQDLEIWAPNIVGSILFLASGYLAFIETCHAYFAWKPRELSWWVTFINLLGCIGFMIAAVLAIVLPGKPNETINTLSVAFVLQGAVCFFLGSLLMLRETNVASGPEAAGAAD
jgi:hypothetical protein